MSFAQSANHWLEVGRLTGEYTRMKVRKIEFLTEIILSLLIAGITISEGGNPEVAAGAIAVVHSFNIARAIEAYKEATVEAEYRQARLDEK